MPIIAALTDAEIPDVDRRLSLFSGNLFVYTPRPSTGALSAAARDRLEELLGPEPMWAQQQLTEVEFTTLFNAAVRSLSRVALGLAADVAVDFGCDPGSTFVGGASLVAATGVGFVAHGLGTPQHPHRDTWYAASSCQVNWWVPLYHLEASTSFAFHPHYWDVPVANNSRDFVYEEWARRLQAIGAAGSRDALTEPRPLAPIDLSPDVQICCPPGGVVLSSAAQLYSGVPNDTLETHFSVHFQTVSEADLMAGRGASNLDAEPQGSALSDFVRCSDQSPIPQELVERDIARRRA